MEVKIISGSHGEGRALVCGKCGRREWLPGPRHLLETKIERLEDVGPDARLNRLRRHEEAG